MIRHFESKLVCLTFSVYTDNLYCCILKLTFSPILVFIAERRLVQQHSTLSHLKDTRLGIEGTHWLRKLLQTSVKEPATAALGGIPIGLKAAIEKELELMKYVLV